LAIGALPSIDDTHYYDPAMPGALEAPTRVVGSDGDWIILDDGTRIRLIPGPIDDCAQLEVDASGHAGAVLVQLALARDAAEPLFGTGDAPVTPT